MKIGILDPLPGRTKVGIHTYTRNVIKHLSKLTPLVVYTSEPGLFNNRNLKVRPIPPAWLKSHFGRLLWEQIGFPHLIREEKIDLLFMPLPEVPVFVNVPVVSVVHDLIPIKMAQYHSFKSKICFFFSLQTLRRAESIIVDSYSTLNDLSRLKMCSRKRIEVIYPGVELPKEVRPWVGYENLPPYILYVGGFAPYKNLFQLLRVYAKLAQEFPHFLILVGFALPSWWRTITHFVAQLRLEERVLLPQNLPEAELYWLYANCAVFVFPSFYEGFGLPVLEAMACGAPVICSNTSSLKEVGGEAAFYFNPTAERELEVAIREVLKNDRLREEMKEKSLSRARLFTWEKTADQIFQVLSGI